MSDLQRFGIDPSHPSADLMVETCRYLETRGVPLEVLRAAPDLGALDLLVWRVNFGLMGTPTSIAEASGAAGLTPEQARTFIRALGFPDSADIESILTTDDVPVLKLFADFSTLIGTEQVAQLARVIGASLSRIAEATADMIRVNIEGPRLDTSTRAEYLQLSDTIASEGLPRLAFAMDRVVRYHLIRVSAQNWTLGAGATATTMKAAIGFADMVGFTAHSATLSASDLAAVIDTFEARVSEVVTSLGGRVVKFIGDEVLFLFEDAGAACACARDLLTLASDQSISDVRVGIAFGEIVTRHGDCYGPVVNTAARLVDVAPPRTIFVTPEVVDRARDRHFERREPLLVKGIDEPVEHYVLRT